MKSSTAKALAGGKKITRVDTWDAIGQTDEDGAKVVRSAMIYNEDTKRYHEGGDTDEEGYVLSEVLNTDMVLRLWTAEGVAWDSGIATHAQVLTTRVDSAGRVHAKCETCGGSGARRVIDPYDADVNNRETWMVLCPDCEKERAEDI